MKLNRRCIRSIKSNLSFYISSTVLTVVTLLLFFLFTTAGNAILDFSDTFFSKNRIEDAHFLTYKPISDEQLEAMEDEFSVQLDSQKYINITTGGITARIFEKTRKINLYEVTEGKDVSKDSDIVISEGFALNKNIKIGDKLKVKDKEYTVTGFIQRPDYLYMLQNESDAYKNISTFYLAYFTDAEFSKFNAPNTEYFVKYSDSSDIKSFRKNIHSRFLLRSYIQAEDNPRINMVTTQADLFISMAYMLLCILPFIAVTLICIIISRKVKSEQKMIGALSAMGYRKGQLMRHYALFAAIPGLIGGILTVVISLFAAQPYSEAGLADYEPMRVTGHIRPLDAFLAIVVPTLIYMASCLLTVRRLLKKDTVLLLSGNADSDRNRKRRMLTESRISFKIKFAVRSLLGAPARSAVVTLGIFLGCLIMLLGTGLLDTVKNTAETSSSSFAAYKYQYILNQLKEENTSGGEPLLIAPAEDEKGRSLTVIGTADGNPFLLLEDGQGNKVLPESGYYISSLLKFAYGWEKGDKITLVNPLSMEETEITVSGTVKNDAQKVIYTSRENAGRTAGISGSFFNSVISDKKLDIPEGETVSVNKISDITDQVDAIVDMMAPMIAVVIVLGIIICISAIYVSVNMMVSENRHNISMLKVLGYTDREINRTVLNVHHILVPVGILLSIPATYGILQLLFRLYVDYGLMLMTAYISPVSYLLSAGLTVLSYILSLCILRRKIRKISMIESLKDNRE